MSQDLKVKIEQFKYITPSKNLQGNSDMFTISKTLNEPQKIIQEKGKLSQYQDFQQIHYESQLLEESQNEILKQQQAIQEQNQVIQKLKKKLKKEKSKSQIKEIQHENKLLLIKEKNNIEKQFLQEQCFNLQIQLKDQELTKIQNEFAKIKDKLSKPIPFGQKSLIAKLNNQYSFRLDKKNNSFKKQ